ncbi:probable dioxygenase (plasmid) [Rhodococcus jostii RHA1]|uniref:Probable dioxygenase n=1 Tax=Rhodococcus jostii (strain RHA1) TaxID=101510 RepID=Q0RW59_RHOJR|nr:PDR/VanB family oxidoreductase [Rhodococcus jostii]ABH00477.1 probable dioxygenase [Rhodococcus jostii RHA1]
MTAAELSPAAQAGEWTRTLVVQERRVVGDRVVELCLAAEDGSALPEWEPGSHVDLLLASGLVRQYSLAGSPQDRSTYRLGVLRELDGRGGSAEVHDTLTAGTPVTVRGPRNNFPLLPSPRYVFIAGGIGITPLIPMLEAASADEADWTLHYGGRNQASLAFADELVARFGARIILHPQDTCGLLPVADLVAGADGALVYCCGPEPLLQAVQAAGDAIGLPARDVHIERFSAREVEAARAGAFEIELTSTGDVLTVPDGGTIVDVLRDHEVLVFTSCEEGMCGTCETRVLAGTPDHLDSFRSPEEHDEDGTMAVCVSRSLSPRLVLDI